MRRLSRDKYAKLLPDEIQYTGSSFKIPVWVIVIRGTKYVLIYGEKISNNFFVNLYYICRRGGCRKIELDYFPNYTTSRRNTRYVRSFKWAKRFFHSAF